MSLSIEFYLLSGAVCFVLGFLLRLGFGTMSAQFKEMERRFDKIDTQLDKIETHFDNRCDLLGKDLMMIANSVRDMDLRITIVETRLEERSRGSMGRSVNKIAPPSMKRLRRISPKAIGHK